MQGVREICDEHGIVFVVDEVQTGFGRTGKMWGIEHHGVEPDLMVVAKSIAAGLPLSGVIGKAEIMDAPPDSAIGGTYVGNPVAQAAALAVLDVFEDEEPRRARRRRSARRSGTRMLAWQERWAEIGDVRGPGRDARDRARPRSGDEGAGADIASAVIEEAFRNGLLLIKSGTDGNCIRVLTPLVITDAELDEALGVWEDALADRSQRVVQRVLRETSGRGR